MNSDENEKSSFKKELIDNDIDDYSMNCIIVNCDSGAQGSIDVKKSVSNDLSTRYPLGTSGKLKSKEIELNGNFKNNVKYDGSSSIEIITIKNSIKSLKNDSLTNF